MVYQQTRLDRFRRRIKTPWSASTYLIIAAGDMVAAMMLYQGNHNLVSPAVDGTASLICAALAVLLAIHRRKA